MSTASCDNLSVFSLTLCKGSRDRVGEDAVCSKLVLDAIARSCDLPSLPEDYLLQSNVGDNEPEAVTIKQTTCGARDYIQRLLDGHVSSVLAVPTGRAVADTTGGAFKYFEDVTLPAGSVVLPGSFNPVHEGHVRLAAIGARRLHDPAAPEPLVIFELSITNADKPSLSIDEVVRRLDVFEKSRSIFEANGLRNYAVMLTAAPLFLGKTEIFKGCHFLVGSDTMVRLLNPKYYKNSFGEMVVALAGIVERKCSFLVAGRMEHGAVKGGPTDIFVTCEDIIEQTRITLPMELPVSIISLFKGIPEEQFRSDLSSTMIREKMKALHK